MRLLRRIDKEVPNVPITYNCTRKYLRSYTTGRFIFLFAIFNTVLYKAYDIATLSATRTRVY